MTSTSTTQAPPVSQRRSAKRIGHERSIWRGPALPLALMVAFLVLGVWLRLAGLHNVTARSPDERTYAANANVLRLHGTAGLRAAVERFRHDSSLEFLPPPTRVGYLWLLGLAMNLTGDTSAAAGVGLSCLASIACLFVVGLIGWQFFSPPVALFATLFYAVSPVELIFAQRTWQESLLELVALALLFIAAKISRGARSWYWFAAFALLGGLSVSLKEVSVASFLLCFAWVLWSLYRARDWRSIAAFCSFCLAAMGVTLALLAWAVGGIHILFEATALNMKAQAVNPYGRQFESGPPFRLMQSFLAVSPVVFLFAVPGIFLAWKRDHSELGLVKAEPVAACLALFTLAFVAAAAFTPHRLNLRYVCMIFGPLYLLGGLGFCWIALRIRGALDGFDRRIFTGFAVVAVVLGALIDVTTFRQNLSLPSVDDLSARMLLDATDPIGPILPMTTDVAPDKLDVAEKLAAKEPSASHLLSLAITYEQAGRFEDSISTAHKVLQIEPSSAEAYNDISAASAGEAHWDASIAAATDALRLDPTYQLAKNNLRWAETQKALALGTSPGS